MDTLLTDTALVDTMSQALSDTTSLVSQTTQGAKPAPETFSWEWWKDLLGMLGAAATALTLIFLLIQNWVQSRRIDHLARLAEQAQEQVKQLAIQTDEIRKQSLEMSKQANAQESISKTMTKSQKRKEKSDMPRFRVESMNDYNSSTNRLTIHLKNIGKAGTIYHVELIDDSGDLKHIPPQLPIGISANETWKKLTVYPVGNSRERHEMKFKVRIRFKSEADICYQQVFECNGFGDFSPNDGQPQEVACES